MASYKLNKLSDLFKGKSNGERLPSLVDLAIAEGLLELANILSTEFPNLADKLNVDRGIAQTDFSGSGGSASDASRQVDTVDYKVDGDPS